MAGIRFVNTGSVGRPKDGDWRASYMLLTLGDADTTVELVRVEYNLGRAVDGLPRSFADHLRTGGGSRP